MSTCIDTAWLDARIAKTKAQIEKLEDAALAIETDAVREYLMDTGQTQTRVTKATLSVLEAALNSLYNRLDVLNARRYPGCSTVTARPAW